MDQNTGAVRDPAAAMARPESAIGYTFSDKSLLRRAMTHSSHSNETGERNHHLLCNERLEFLGDSVLSIAVSRYLYATYPQEGEGTLTNMRKDVVCAEALARYARAIGIGDEIEPDIDTFPLSGEECAMTHVFLCTDGFSGALDEDDCMKKINDPEKGVEEKATELVAHVKEIDGSDNITLVVIDLGDIAHGKL